MQFLRRAALVAAALAWLASMSYAGAPDAASERLRQFFADNDVISAAFIQQLSDADGRIVEIAEGRLLIARPNRLRWDYTEPDQVVLADGERLWLYDREVDQVTISDQVDSIGGSPAALLSGNTEALDAFDVLGSTTAGGLTWVELAPRADDVDFSRVRIGFAADTLAAMVLTDKLGQTTDIRFRDVVVDAPYGPDAFRLDLPDYVDVIDKSTSADDAEVSVR